MATRRKTGSQSVILTSVDSRELLAALNKVDKQIQNQLRDLSFTDSKRLAQQLSNAAGDIGVPNVAMNVAESITPRRDRTVKVSVGGTKRVGRPYRSTKTTKSGKRSSAKIRAQAGAVMWGSEYGSDKGVDRAGRAYTNRFGEPRNTDGYWIGPTVRKYGREYAETWQNRVIRIIKGLGLD